MFVVVRGLLSSYLTTQGYVPVNWPPALSISDAGAASATATDREIVSASIQDEAAE